MTYANFISDDRVRVGLLIPFHGPIGFWGLSSEKCAQLAVAELNNHKGILGKEMELVLIDASGAPEEVAAKTNAIVTESRIQALVGMHTSDIRVAIVNQLQARIPFVYTPMYEGGDSDSGVFMVGDTPESLISTMISWLSTNMRTKSWYLIGNDYLYPRKTHQIAKELLKGHNKTVVAEEFVGFDVEDFSPHIRRIQQARPDVVLISLIGHSNVLFNRLFGQSGLSDDIIRYCCAIEENSLYGIGPKNTRNIFSTMSYHRDLNTEAARCFAKLYSSSFGVNAPELNQFATSCYDGFMMLSNLSDMADSLESSKFDEAAQDISGVYGPRGELRMTNKKVVSDLHVVVADGTAFRTL